MKPTTLFASQCILGEGPYWHADKKSFFWVDIESGILYQHELATKKTKTRKFDHRLTLVVEGKGDQLILALDRKIARYDLVTEKLEWLAEVEKDEKLNRFNDGKCDAKGRLWAGTLHREFTEGAAAFYRIGTDLKVEKQLEKISVSNGLAWTEDNKTMYYIDSPTHEVKAFHFDLEKGEIEFDRVAVKIPDGMGTPDGMTIDREGNLWVAHYGGSGVYCWNPTNGELVHKIELPVQNATSCTFGGENLDQLLITTASENLTEEQLKEFPQSGDTFLVKTNTQGYLPNKCGL